MGSQFLGFKQGLKGKEVKQKVKSAESWRIMTGCKGKELLP